MALDPQFRQRLAKFVVINNKCDSPEECIGRMVGHSLMISNKVNGLSEKEASDCIISMVGVGEREKDRKEHVASGLLCALLVSENEESFRKYFHLCSLIDDHWFSILCSVNMVLIEVFPRLQESVKDNVMQFFRNAIRLMIPKIENVLMNFVRTLTGTGDWNSKLRLSFTLASLLQENERWMLGLKQGSFLFPMLITTFGHLIADIAVDNVRTVLVNLCVFIIRNRSVDSFMLGRDLVLVLMRLSRIPQFAQLWKELLSQPAKFGIQSFAEVMFRTDQNYHATLRLSPEMTKKVEFIIYQVKPNSQGKHFEWFMNSHLKGPDAGSLRAELIRFTLFYMKDQMPPAIYEARMHFIYFLIINAQGGAELQWLKTTLWIDWLLYDPACPIYVIEPPLALIRYSLSANATKANTLLEYVAKSVGVLHPPMKEQIRLAANAAMKMVADSYAASNQHLGNILENVRLDRPVRDLVREVWKDFVKPVCVPGGGGGTTTPTTTAGPPSAAPAVPSISAAPSPSSSPVAEKKEETMKNGISAVDPPVTATRKKSASPPPVFARPSRAVNKEEMEQEVESNYQMLRDDIKPIVAALRESFQSEETDDSEKGEAVQLLLQRLLDSDGSIDEEQLELMGQCLHGLIGRPVEWGKSLLPETLTEEALQDSFVHPLFIIFRNLCFTPANDFTTRAPLVTIIAAMRDRDPTITYLLLYFIKAGIAGSHNDSYVCYEEVARACDKELCEMLAEDLEHCAIDDDRLFAFILPYVFEKFTQEAGASSEVFRVVCSHIDAQQLMDMVGAIVRENMSLFRKDSFSSIVMASLEWETIPQWAFWQLAHAEGIPVDWVTVIIPKLNSSKHAEAVTNILLMLKRIDREPTMSLLRAILSRTPVIEDTFTVNALKILIEEADMCTKVAELLSSLLRKQLNNGDFHMTAASKVQGKKGAQRLSMEQVLIHLEHFTQLCLTRETKVAEALLSKWHVQEAFNAIRSCEKAAFLRPKYGQLFAVMECLSEDSPQSSRTLRGNRGGSMATKSKKREDEKEDDGNGTPSKKRKRNVIVLDSDSD